MSETLTVLEINVETGEEIIRDLTQAEIFELEKQHKLHEKEKKDALAAEQARQASIRKMAEASGLTETEIEALF